MGRKEKKKIDKGIFATHAEFECERNVFLELSRIPEDFSTWRLKEEIQTRTRNPITDRLITERGVKYEQEVYKEIREVGEYLEKRKGTKQVHASISKQDTVYRTLLAKNNMQEFSKNTYLQILLEFEYEITHSFLPMISDLDIAPCRPDIMVLKPIRSLFGDVKHFDQNGTLQDTPFEQITAKYGISIIDIKSIPGDRVGHKYYNEILYYLHSLNAFIHDHQLTEYVVLAEGNGILPTVENIKLRDFEELTELMIEIDIEQVDVLYDNTITIIEELSSTIPRDRTTVSQKYGAHCDKCDYLNDCLIKSGYSGGNWASSVDIELLPNVNNSIISQLKEDRITSIEELTQAIPRLGQSNYPQPINAILPLLRHKSQSIKSNQIEYAKPDEIYSMSIPRYTRNRVTFTLETDSTTDQAFGFGILLESAMSINSKAKHKELFSKWWRVWIDYFRSNEKYDKSKVEQIFKEFQTLGFLDISISDVKKFAKYLHEFQSTKIGDRQSLRFVLPGEKLPSGRVSRQTVAELAFVNISLNITPGAEEQFLHTLIKKVSKIIQITLILEKYIKSGGSFASSAFYYWSPEIVEKIEELIEKHLHSVISDTDMYTDLFFISQWISPASQVTDPNQLKRIYDLSKFVESTLGLPLPINYTWHKVASQLLTNFGYNANYWSDLFNNMDRSHWHTFIVERDEDQAKASKKYSDIQSQIFSKVRTLGFLVNHFQNAEMTRTLISDNPINIPKEVSTRATDLLPRDFHALARNWYLFATLTESVDEIEKVELRSTYPEAAIGKLEAASATNINRIINEKDGKTKYAYEFELQGLSRNVKFSEGARLLLIPIQIRDSILSYGARQWLVTLQEMNWISVGEYYHVRTEERDKDIFQLAKDLEVNPNTSSWFLYPDSVGYWATKLFKRKNPASSLLVRNNMGNSMLGHRVAVMWDIGAMKQLPPIDPKKFVFNMAEVFMFAPDTLQNIIYPRPQNLLCNTEFPPDPSQKEAIYFALESPLRLILGPPGTGKSQTIVALIDEFLERRAAEGHSNNRILITSFAYTASNVLLEKICRGQDSKGNPNRAAQAQKVYIMSQSRQLPQLSEHGPTFKVNKLVKKGVGWNFDNERITPKGETKLGDLISGDVIFFGNAHQIYKLDDAKDGDIILDRKRLEFDLIIVDEASQLPTDHMLSIYQHVRSADIKMQLDFDYRGGPMNPVEIKSISIENPEDIKTHVVLVGDDAQLPPVQQIKPPKNLQVHLGSVFDFYKNVDGFGLDTKQLKYNYRSHSLIVGFTASLQIYEELLPSPNSQNRKRLLSGNLQRVENNWSKDILDPDRVVLAMVHDNQYDTSVSLLEAKIAVQLILDYFLMIDPQTEEDQIHFWYEGIGIVAPHNAHSRTIINLLFQELTVLGLSLLNADQLMTALKETIFSVEKFQGSERDMIIGTIGVSAKDQLRAEEEFIYNLNRINVLTTRAKSKMILICSENFLQHIPEEQDRFREIAILKKYVYKYCNQNYALNIDIDQEPNEFQIYYRSV